MTARVAGVWRGEKGGERVLHRRSSWRVMTDDGLFTAMAVRKQTVGSILHLPTLTGEITQTRVSIDSKSFGIRAADGRGRHVYSALAAVTWLAKRIWR